jgi:hypothetical protein
LKIFFVGTLGIKMSAPQEFMFTAEPEMPQCQGEGCYCFHGRNQMDATFSDDEDSSSSDNENAYSEHYVEPWQILHNEVQWTIALDQLIFRHPRVLLAYFRFVLLHNEIASQKESILLPQIPDNVVDFILGHTSFQNPPPEFKEDVEELRTHVMGFKVHS